MKSKLHYELNKRGVELGKKVRAYVSRTKLKSGRIVKGTVIYIHPQARFVVLDLGLYKMAFHPFAIELNGVFIDKQYQEYLDNMERGSYNNGQQQQ